MDCIDYLWLVLSPQRRQQALNSLVFNRHLTDMKVHCFTQAQTLQLLSTQNVHMYGS